MFEYIIGDSFDPFINLATEQVLMESAGKHNIIFLWQNDNTIVVGRNQNIYDECKMEEFLEQGGKIARRKSGGGTVYHDLGNLNFSILCKEEERKVFSYQNIIKNTLVFFGIEPEFNGRNDLLIDNRKFSGNAVYMKEGIVCQHGTILISTDIDRMCYFLTPEKNKLERNNVRSVNSRVMNLSSVIPNLTVDRMILSMIKATEAKKSDLTIDDFKISVEESFFRSKEWLYGGKL